MNSFFLRFLFLLLALTLGVGEGAACSLGCDCKEAGVQACFEQAEERRDDGSAGEAFFSQTQNVALPGAVQTFGGGQPQERNEKTKRPKRLHNTHYSFCTEQSGRNDEQAKKIFTAFRNQKSGRWNAQQERTKRIRVLHFASDLD